MGEYDRQIALAVRMIAQKGQLVQWKKPGAATGTLANPISGTPEFIDTRILFLPNKRDGLASFLSVIQDTEVPTGGIKGLMATVPFEPLLVDTVIRGTEELVLDGKNGIEALAPNGEIILYFLRFTR